MAGYVPELGQAAFGQPHQAYEVPEIMVAVLTLISHEVDRLTWNIHQEEIPSAFSNSGGAFSCDTFAVEAYSWNDEVEQPWNFKCGDLEISWYKYMGRGMSANRDISPDDASAVLRKCLDALDGMEAQSE